MTARIRIEAATAPPDRSELAPILAEFLDRVGRLAAEEAGIGFDTARHLALTLDHLGDALPPRGATLLARPAAGGAPVGMVFLRRIRPDTGEIKRLYVRPSTRGSGLGRALMDRALAEARALGLVRVVLDTGLWDREAHRLYEALGFADTEPYAETANAPDMAPWLRFMALDLAAGT